MKNLAQKGLMLEQLPTSILCRLFTADSSFGDFSLSDDDWLCRSGSEG